MVMQPGLPPSDGVSERSFALSRTLTVVDLVTVHEPVSADFAGSPTHGPAPLSVAFTDLSTGAVDTWSWDFGDGGSSSAENPGHVYAAPGSYTVSLTASGPGGTDTRTSTMACATSYSRSPETTHRQQGFP